MNSSKNKSLVTGGCGFVGSHMVDLLINKGHEVIVIDDLSTGVKENLFHHVDSPNVKIFVRDIADPDAFEGIMDNVKWVFHFAAMADIVPSIVSPMTYFMANANGTANLLEVSRAAGVERFIYAASSSCYGLPDTFPTPETAAIAPQYPYAMTKRIGEELVMHWSQVYSIPALSLRMFNVYGPRHRTAGSYGAMFGVFLAQKLAGEPLTIVGDGEQTRDFTFVTDVVDAYYTAAKSSLSGEVFNIGSDGTYSVNRIAELLGGECVHIPKRPGEPDCTWADITKIKTLMGWSPKVGLEEGVRILLDNIDGWKDAPVWTPDTIKEATADWFKYLGEKDA